MAFHLMPWFAGTARGNYLISNAVLLSPDGAQILNNMPNGSHAA
ncbi:MAG TPA: hypothetical protein QF597_05260 [Arenicellales bacterium]|nr:hypothetical protein [Arenicellales bacterium]HJL56887.1 hypothetical protein [Arenicellales bacterium]